MARNGSGTYIVPNTFSDGEVISAPDHNENFSDIATALTNSLATDGQSPMTAPFKASSGSVAAPSLTFSSDTNTGRYRKSADTIADVCGGAEIVEYSSTGINVTGAIKQNGLSLLPAGLGPLPWSGTNAPDGWLLCHGQEVSRTTYADLWTFAQAEIALGNALWDDGDGSTTFTLPDPGGRVIAGKEATATRLTAAGSGINGATLGATGGSETHTLSIAESAAHDHGGTAALTASTTGMKGAQNTGIGGGQAGFTQYAMVADGSNPDKTLTVTGTAAISSQGSGTAHNNVQPTLIANFIIKT